LKKLQLDYVDLSVLLHPSRVDRRLLTALCYNYLIYSPYVVKQSSDLQKAWIAKENIKATGKAKSIGVSNHQWPHLETIQGWLPYFRRSISWYSTRISSELITIYDGCESTALKLRASTV
jgi:diketogulonate reductase-like aldo/keto reductase